MTRTVDDIDIPDDLRDDVKVVDNFYQSPEAVREFALGLEYTDYNGRKNFPGKESVQAYAATQHLARFADIVGQPVRADPGALVFGKFRLALAGDGAEARTKVHIDKVAWTAVVYLSPTPDGGDLGFYEHRGLGLRTVPTDPTRYGCENLHAFDERYIFESSKDESNWELIGRIPATYNRCVVFRGSRIFHGITTTFGRSAASGRLTQNFFMQT